MRSLSVCIPVYNCDVTELVKELCSQLKEAELNNEIILIDDASDEKYKKVNKSIESNKNVVYIELEKNIGRSAIRNLFLKHTNFENLLFLDCDSKILHQRFVHNYLAIHSKTTKVICGGRSYSQKPKKSKYLLRWKYGINRECKMADERTQKPYHSFMTNNFLIKRSVSEAIKFDKNLKGYGHEDSLFGYHLMKNNIPIKHIDNQTIHDFNETSDEFLEKTRQGIENLVFIHTKLLPKGEFTKKSKLLTSYEKVKKKKLTGFLSILSYPLLPLLAVLFREGVVCLWCFDVYKLFYLSRIAKKS